MKAKHTSGGWIAVGRRVEHVNDSVPDICSCNPADFDQDERSDAEACANARLIAAAPELLEALKELDAKPEYTSSWIKARAAIAKATGSAS